MQSRSADARQPHHSSLPRADAAHSRTSNPRVGRAREHLTKSLSPGSQSSPLCENTPIFGKKRDGGSE